MSGKIEHVNPDGLLKNPAFSQIVTTQGSGKTIYIGGQNAVTEKGEIIGKGDVALQTGQVIKNLFVALGACGVTFENVVKMSVYIVQGQDISLAFRAFQGMMGNTSTPPAITVLIVSGLANPEFLIEIDAVAFLPE